MTYTKEGPASVRPQPSIIIFSEVPGRSEAIKVHNPPHYLSVLRPSEFTERSKLPGTMPIDTGKFLKSLVKVEASAKDSKLQTRENQDSSDVKEKIIQNASTACANWIETQLEKNPGSLPKSMGKLCNILNPRCKVKLSPDNCEWIIESLIYEGIIKNCTTCGSLHFHPEHIKSTRQLFGAEFLTPDVMIKHQVERWIQSQPLGLLPRTYEGLRSHVSSSYTEYTCNVDDVTAKLLAHKQIELIGIIFKKFSKFSQTRQKKKPRKKKIHTAPIGDHHTTTLRLKKY